MSMMHFDNKGVALMGKHGLIGSALSKKDLPPGVYFFDSVSSIVQFNEQMDWCMRETINSFIEVLSYCKRTGTPLIFPSSATVYNKNTAYSRCKAIIEELYYAYDYPALGFRISAGYGPGEAHKGKSASVVYQWCRDMKQGIRPIIFGDGTQTRDFIHVDDIADYIAKMATEGATGIYDVGTGVNTTFNDLVATINKVLDTNLQPIYVDKPKNYVPDTIVKAVPHKYSLEDGIREICDSI